MKFKLLFILLLLSFVFYGCPNSTEPEPDPCEGKYPVSADFEIWEGSQAYKYKFLTDTVIHKPNYAVFVCKNNYDYYEWKVGSQEKKYYTKEFSLSFYDHGVPFVENPIPIRLIVKSKPDSLCYPADDGIDTVFKSIYIVKYQESRIFGDYYGYDTTNPNVYYTVNIGKKYIEKKNWTYFYINNLHNSCIDTAFFTNMDMGNVVKTHLYYTAMVFNGFQYVGCGCLQPEGVAYLADGQDSLIINYTIIKEFAGPKLPMKFIGKRIK